jgi:hypothetical protein
VKKKKENETGMKMKNERQTIPKYYYYKPDKSLKQFNMKENINMRLK